MPSFFMQRGLWLYNLLFGQRFRHRSGAVTTMPCHQTIVVSNSPATFTTTTDVLPGGRSALNSLLPISSGLEADSSLQPRAGRRRKVPKFPPPLQGFFEMSVLDSRGDTTMPLRGDKMRNFKTGASN